MNHYAEPDPCLTSRCSRRGTAARASDRWGRGSRIDPERLKELVLCIFDCDTEPELGTVPDYVKGMIRKEPPAEQQTRAARRGTGRSA